MGNACAVPLRTKAAAEARERARAARGSVPPARCQSAPQSSPAAHGFLESLPGGSLVVYARAFELAGITTPEALCAITNADLNRVSERGMIPVLPDHRRRILAASAAYATAQAERAAGGQQALPWEDIVEEGPEAQSGARAPGTAAARAAQVLGARPAREPATVAGGAGGDAAGAWAAQQQVLSALQQHARVEDPVHGRRQGAQPLGPLDHARGAVAAAGSGGNAAAGAPAAGGGAPPATGAAWAPQGPGPRDACQRAHSSGPGAIERSCPSSSDGGNTWGSASASGPSTARTRPTPSPRPAAGCAAQADLRPDDARAGADAGGGAGADEVPLTEAVCTPEPKGARRGSARGRGRGGGAAACSVATSTSGLPAPARGSADRASQQWGRASGGGLRASRTGGLAAGGGGGAAAVRRSRATLSFQTADMAVPRSPARRAAAAAAAAASGGGAAGGGEQAGFFGLTDARASASWGPGAVAPSRAARRAPGFAAPAATSGRAGARPDGPAAAAPPAAAIVAPPRGPGLAAGGPVMAVVQEAALERAGSSGSNGSASGAHARAAAAAAAAAARGWLGALASGGGDGGDGAQDSPLRSALSGALRRGVSMAGGSQTRGAAPPASALPAAAKHAAPAMAPARAQAAGPHRYHSWRNSPSPTGGGAAAGDNAATCSAGAGSTARVGLSGPLSGAKPAGAQWQRGEVRAV